jgi:hypothetical protein
VGGIVNTTKIVVVVGVVLVGAGSLPGRSGSQAPPDIRMLLTQPQRRVPPDAAGVPDLRDVPMPKMDKPPVQPPITIVVSDPRCYPGEDGLGSPGQFNRRSRRPH